MRGAIIYSTKFSLPAVGGRGGRRLSSVPAASTLLGGALLLRAGHVPAPSLLGRVAAGTAPVHRFQRAFLRLLRHLGVQVFLNTKTCF